MAEPRMTRRLLTLIGLTLSLTHCVDPKLAPYKREADGPPLSQVDVSQVTNAKPRHLKHSRYGNPASYVVNGKRYFVLATANGYDKIGIASWYGRKFHGRLTSTREPYNMLAMTAASPTLPIPCFARVTNLSNGKSIVVKVNDRGPFAPNRIMDLSYAAAKKLDIIHHGTARVRVTAIDTSQPGQTPHFPQLYLQVGAYGDYDNASAAKEQAYLVTSKPARIVEEKHGQQSIFKVIIGPLTNTAESDRLLMKFSHAGYHNIFSRRI